MLPIYISPSSNCLQVAVLGADRAARVANPFDLPLGPLKSVMDSVPPIVDADRSVEAAADASQTPDVSIGEAAAVEMAAAIADTLVTEPAAPAIDQIQVIMKDEVNVPARSIRSTRSATARSREATPISVIVR